MEMNYEAACTGSEGDGSPSDPGHAVGPLTVPEVQMRVSVLWAVARALLVLATCVPIVHAEEAPAPVEVRILAINDFHGNLMPPPGGIQISDRVKKVTVPAGGAEHMAALIKELRAGRSNTIFVAAGDLIGASPLLSSLFHDEPTIDSLSLMGLDLSSVGNHEFDKGKIELLRMQYGGCHADGGCQGPHRFHGAKFHYLAANVIEKSTGKTLFPAYDIRNFDGVPVAFIGLTTRDTPRIVSPSGTAGLDFGDEQTAQTACKPRRGKDHRGPDPAADPGRRVRAGRHHRRCSARRDQHRRQRRSCHRVHELRGHSHRHS
jgi:5'-nucleotidase